MRLDSVPAFLEAMRRCRLLEAEQLDDIERAAAPRYPDPLELAKELVRRGMLTPFQVNQLLQGNGGELVLGNYLLLERIGEGGMGTVFKARHRMIDRLVALKVLRKDRLTHPDASKRFEREIKAAAQLAHPNVVTAFDAGQIGDTHYFTMEYIQGIDLGKLSKEKGPLPITDACDYIRQAACGLAHAHEKGMVHRDIKPSNLLLCTKDGVVKILDLGLARLEDADAELPANNLTREGRVVGTVDYLAPEQAINSHRVDIRADLYSLGCTLYQLLAGRVPFKRGNALEKLARHRWEEPKALEKLRPEVPAPVIAVVRRLMAKKPEDRFQTPAELATALALLAGHAGNSRNELPLATPLARFAESPHGSLPIARLANLGDRPETPVSDRTVGDNRSRPQPAADRHLYALVAIGVVVMLIGMVLAALLATR